MLDTVKPGGPLSMPTRATLEIIQMCLNITSSKCLSLHPIQMKYTKNRYHVFRAKLTQIMQQFWISILTLSFTVTLIELSCSLKGKDKNLLTVLYHLFLLLSKLTSLLWLFVLNQKSYEITQLLYYFCQYPKSFLVALNQPKNKLNSMVNSKFSYFLTISLIVLSMFYIAFLPLVTLMVPCLHPVLLIIHGNCSNIVVRSAAFIVQLFVLMPACGVGCVGISVALVIVNEIFTNLNKCWLVNVLV